MAEKWLVGAAEIGSGAFDMKVESIQQSSVLTSVLFLL